MANANVVRDVQRLKFRAALSSGTSALSVDSEGETKLTLEVPASELASVLKLLLYRGKVFTVEIS